MHVSPVGCAGSDGAKLVKLPTDCERLYDLLGLYERADLLITTDTATFWLAHAVHIPTIVLHQTDTWCRAPFPPATVFHSTYEGALARRRKLPPTFAVVWRRRAVSPRPRADLSRDSDVTPQRSGTNHLLIIPPQALCVENLLVAWACFVAILQGLRS